MAQETKPQSIADRKRDAEANAALEQMYGYFTPEERRRPVVSELDARKAA